VTIVKFSGQRSSYFGSQASDEKIWLLYELCCEKIDRFSYTSEINKNLFCIKSLILINLDPKQESRDF